MIKNKMKTNLEIMKAIRGSWGSVNPVTKIIPNKKKYDRKRAKAQLYRNKEG